MCPYITTCMYRNQFCSPHRTAVIARASTAHQPAMSFGSSHSLSRNALSGLRAPLSGLRGPFFKMQASNNLTWHSIVLPCYPVGMIEKDKPSCSVVCTLHLDPMQPYSREGGGHALGSACLFYRLLSQSWTCSIFFKKPFFSSS